MTERVTCDCMRVAEAERLMDSDNLNYQGIGLGVKQVFRLSLVLATLIKITLSIQFPTVRG